MILVPIAIGAGGSVGAGLLVGLIAVVAFFYLFTKFILTPAVIAIERQSNPLAALGRSWRLTKGNSLRIFLFVLLLFLAVGVVGGVISMIVGLFLALAGSQAALIGQAVVSGLINAVFYVIFLGVLAAIYRQLAGPSPEMVRETFE
jgi:membrane-anchored glycerophosphoryl diester phosphodiesterase (GDPDase)